MTKTKRPECTATPSQVTYRTNSELGDRGITRADLEWWFDFASSREWTFARTYAQTAPHHYVVQDRTPNVNHEDMVRAARVIHTFGQPGKYYSVTKIYLLSPDGQFRWWTEDDHFTDTTLVNRATTKALYGIQNAPSTLSRHDSPWDKVATSWDASHPIRTDEAVQLRNLLAGVRGKYPPHILDLGCGTGRLLDLGIAKADRYAGLDSSRAMLNMLLRKHPRVAAIYPVEIGEALVTHMFSAGQFDWVFLDSAVELTDEQRIQVRQIARLALIEMSPSGCTVSDVSKASVHRILANHGSGPA